MLKTVSRLSVSVIALTAVQSGSAAFAAEASAEMAALEMEVAPESDSNQPGLIDIVVTATKRETNLQETPIAIAVMS
ncbi:MAG: hypothetical protein WA793_04155 [Sphingorhabdus sp.]|uniref:hypothetical protein n=1 Tax=Sphingorhabdus sp. TaxID=1902408 RepID=UPI003CA4E28E